VIEVFSDIQLKLNYYKEKIIQSYIKRGIYPNNKLIQSKLDDIDLRLAIFGKPTAKSGDTFNTKEINYAINEIYIDLTFLYNLLYKITVQEYNDLNNYIDSHIRELQDISDMYLKRANLESYSTALGTSIFFKHNDFDMTAKDDCVSIDLGTINIDNASKIVCIADINNVDYKNVIFKFINNSNNMSCNSYSYNHDSIIFPGDVTRNEYPITMHELQKINSLVNLPIVADDTEDSTFITLAGENKVMCKKIDSSGSIKEETVIDTSTLTLSDHSYIDFYVLNGVSISFRFNKNPIATNFNLNSEIVTNLDYVHHFFLECEAGTTFDFEIEKGSVFAIQEKTIISEGNFYYSGNTEVTDFLIVQTLPGETQTYNASIEVYNTSISQDDINSVMIKKIE
jgi:hypothetical protein